MVKKFHILVTSHENLCQGYLEAAALIVCNDREGIAAIPFTKNMDPTFYEEQLRSFIEEKQSKPLVILTDLLGGTPNNIAASFLKEGQIQVITGINLSLLLEIVMAQENGQELAALDFSRLLTNAKNSMLHINAIFEGGKEHD